MRITKARVDRGKLHVAFEGLGREQAISLLFDAIALVPDTEIAKLVARHIDVKQVNLDEPKKQRLLYQVRAFDAASRATAVSFRRALGSYVPDHPRSRR